MLIFRIPWVTAITLPVLFAFCTACFKIFSKPFPTTAEEWAVGLELVVASFGLQLSFFVMLTAGTDSAATGEVRRWFLWGQIFVLIGMAILLKTRGYNTSHSMKRWALRIQNFVAFRALLLTYRGNAYAASIATWAAPVMERIQR